MKEGLGVPWLWQLPDTHPFHEAGVRHDRAYDERIGDSSWVVDRIFLNECLEIAGTSRLLKVQAYLFYLIVRAWGAIYW